MLEEVDSYLGASSLRLSLIRAWDGGAAADALHGPPLVLHLDKLLLAALRTNTLKI